MILLFYYHGLWLTIWTTPPIYTQFLFLLRSPSSTFQSIIRIVYTSDHENFPFAADNHDITHSPAVRLLATSRNASIGPREIQLCIQFVRTIPHDSWISFSRRRWPKRSDRKSLKAHHIELLIQLMIPPRPTEIVPQICKYRAPDLNTKKMCDENSQRVFFTSTKRAVPLLIVGRRKQRKNSIHSRWHHFRCSLICDYRSVLHFLQASLFYDRAISAGPLTANHFKLTQRSAQNNAVKRVASHDRCTSLCSNRMRWRLPLRSGNAAFDPNSSIFRLNLEWKNFSQHIIFRNFFSYFISASPNQRQKISRAISQCQKDEKTFAKSQINKYTHWFLFCVLLWAA